MSQTGPHAPPEPPEPVEPPAPVLGSGSNVPLPQEGATAAKLNINNAATRLGRMAGTVRSRLAALVPRVEAGEINARP